MNKTKIAVYSFIASESVFFTMLIVAYVKYRHVENVDAAKLLSFWRTLAFSFALFSSSGTVRIATWRARAGSVRGLRVWLVITILLGVLFLIGEGLEWNSLFSLGVSVPVGLFGTTFFTLTGFHGLHVTVGLVALATLLVLSASGRLGPEHREALEGVELYWHFVDIVWVAIFSVVYLGAVT